MSELNLGEPVGEATGESIGEPIGVRWQPDVFARGHERRHGRAGFVRLTTRCRFCDRRVHPARAIDGRFGLSHERCWEERLRAGRPHLWLVDSAGVGRRSGLAPELEDGAHAVLREAAGACSIIPALRDRALAFLQLATARGLVPALPHELPSVGEHPIEAKRLLAQLHAERGRQMFALLVKLGRDIRAEPATDNQEAREERAIARRRAGS